MIAEVVYSAAVIFWFLALPSGVITYIFLTDCLKGL